MKFGDKDANEYLLQSGVKRLKKKQCDVPGGGVASAPDGQSSRVL